MTIFEIEKAIRDILEEGFSVDEDGVILFDDTNFNELQIEREKKLEAIGLMVKEYSAEAEAIKAEKMNLAKREKASQTKAEHLKNLLEFSLKGEKFKTSKVEVAYRKSETVEIAEGTVLPEAYLRYKDPEPDKMGLKKALKEGIEIEGCSLVSKQNMQIK